MIKETNSIDLPKVTNNELSNLKIFLTDFTIDNICGFLKIINGSESDVTVEAQSNGCFRWVFSKNGTVTAISGKIRVFAGQRQRGYSTNDEIVGINCDC